MSEPLIVYVLGMDPIHLSFVNDRILYNGRRFFLSTTAFQMGVWDEFNEISLEGHNQGSPRRLIAGGVISFLRAIQALVGGSSEQEPRIYCPEPPEDIPVGGRYTCMIEPIYSSTSFRKVSPGTPSRLIAGGVVFKASVFKGV